MDSHPKIVNNPFDFGASLLKDEFIEFSLAGNKESYVRKYYAHDDIKKIIITVDLEEGKGFFSIGQLFIYLFQADRKYADLFDTTYSKKKGSPNLPGDFQVTDYNFSIFPFLSDFTDKLLSIKNFSSIEHLQDTLYTSMIINSDTMKQNYSEDCLFVQSSYNGYDFVEQILKKNINRKIIAVVTDPIRLSYINYNRQNKYWVSTNNSNSFAERIINKYTPSLYSKTFINKVKHYNKSIGKLSNMDDVFIVKTEDVICNHKKTMDGIAKFLCIEHHEILYKPTVAGDTMGGKMLSLVGSFQDDPYKVLSKTQLDILKYYFYGHLKYSFFNRILIDLLRLRTALIYSLINNRLIRSIYRLLKKLF